MYGGVERRAARDLRNLEVWIGRNATIAPAGTDAVPRSFSHLPAHRPGKPDPNGLRQHARRGGKGMPFRTVRTGHVVCRVGPVGLRHDRPLVKRHAASSARVNITDRVGNEPLVIVRPLDEADEFDGLTCGGSRHEQNTTIRGRRPPGGRESPFHRESPFRGAQWGRKARHSSCAVAS